MGSNPNSVAGRFRTVYRSPGSGPLRQEPIELTLASKLVLSSLAAAAASCSLWEDPPPVPILGAPVPDRLEAEAFVGGQVTLIVEISSVGSAPVAYEIKASENLSAIDNHSGLLPPGETAQILVEVTCTDRTVLSGGIEIDPLDPGLPSRWVSVDIDCVYLPSIME